MIGALKNGLVPSEKCHISGIVAIFHQISPYIEESLGSMSGRRILLQYLDSLKNYNDLNFNMH